MLPSIQRRIIRYRYWRDFYLYNLIYKCNVDICLLKMYFFFFAAKKIQVCNSWFGIIIDAYKIDACKIFFSLHFLSQRIKYGINSSNAIGQNNYSAAIYV
jgi:hypothetical protein